MASGSGFLSGYGYIARSAYATPLELGFKSWTLDFSPVNGGVAFPTQARLNPYLDPAKRPLQWQTEDWDPALRFWTLAFDSQLIEWLQDLDISAPSILAAREFAPAARQVADGRRCARDSRYPARQGLAAARAPGIGAVDDTATASQASAWTFINSELEELIDMMEDDRDRYLRRDQIGTGGRRSRPTSCTCSGSTGEQADDDRADQLRAGHRQPRVHALQAACSSACGPSTHLPRTGAAVRAAAASVLSERTLVSRDTSSRCCCSKSTRSPSASAWG